MYSKYFKNTEMNDFIHFRLTIFINYGIVLYNEIGGIVNFIYFKKIAKLPLKSV